MPIPTARSPHETVELIRRHADRTIKTPSRAAVELRAIRRLAQRLDLEIDHKVRLAERQGTEPQSKPKQARAVVGCSIESGRYGFVVSECRSSGTAPFRCPKPMYDLVAEVINDTPESFKFNRIYEQVQDRTGEEIADYQVRFAPRSITDVGAVKRSRARFTQDAKNSFRRIAKEAWDDLQRRIEAGQIPA